MSAGQVLAKGHIGVDARRAVSKLREHLLVDLHGYLLELVRVAVLTDTDQIRLHYDADDLYLRWDKPACSVEEAGRLLDYALAYGDDERGCRLRLLALGVNAALGLDPSHVDLYLPAPDGRCARFRFAPEKLESEEGALAERSDGVMPPDTRGFDGTCIHVRRRWGWSTLMRALTRNEPPEIELLRASADHLPMSLALNDAPLERLPQPVCLVRLRSNDVWRIAVDFVASEAVPHLAYLELGVRLLEQPWSPWPQAAMAHLGHRLSVRGILDAPALPTNASRSAVRLEDRQLMAAHNALERALGTAISGLANQVAGQEHEDDGVEVCAYDPQQLAELWGRIGCVLVDASRGAAALATCADDVLDLALLRNAVGQPMTLRSVLARVRNGQYLMLLRADAPLPLDCEPWVRHAAWAHAPWVEMTLAPLIPGDLGAVVPQIKAGVQRRRKLLTGLASAPTVPPASDTVARQAFTVDGLVARCIDGVG